MIGLFIILLQTHVMASTTAPGCQELARILSNAEKELMNSHAPNCRELNIASLLPQEITSETQDFFDENKCSPFYQIEAQIAELENQEALLIGFEKLKNEIAQSQESIQKEKDKKAANKAAKEFAQALNTAQSIELMLDTFIDGKDVNYLQLLAAENPKEWESVDKLKSLTTKFCNKISNAEKLPVCVKDQFKPNEQTHKELRELLRNRSLSKEEAQQWKRSLSIQNADGSEFSFVEMADKIKSSYIKLLKGEVLNEDEMRQIRALDRFHSNPQFNYAKALPPLPEDTLTQSKIKSLVAGLKRRQEVELNSKMSIVASLNNDLMDDGQRSSCHLVQMNSVVDTTCLDALNTTLMKAKTTRANDQTAQLSEALEGFHRTRNYIRQLDDLTKLCDKDLEKCALSIPLDLAAITDQLTSLRMIKEKTAIAQTKNLTFRNFALSKWKKNCSDDIASEDLTIEECYDISASISPEAEKLSSSLMDISIVIDPQKSSFKEDEVKALCENEEVKKLADQRRLCAYFTDKVSDELPKDPKVNPDSFIAEVEAPKGSNSNRENWLKGLAMIANTAADAWVGNNNSSYFGNFSPYNFNFTPYPLTGTMGTADSILFNARYYGAYGLYMPTQGLQPYTTFGSGSITSYAALPRSSSSSSYFAR